MTYVFLTCDVQPCIFLSTFQDDNVGPRAAMRILQYGAYAVRQWLYGTDLLINKILYRRPIMGIQEVRYAPLRSRQIEQGAVIPLVLFWILPIHVREDTGISGGGYYKSVDLLNISINTAIRIPMNYVWIRV